MRVELWSEHLPYRLPDVSGSKETRPYMVKLEPPGEGPFPAVVICPGGAYSDLNEHEGEPVARWLNALGFTAFVLHYRVRPHLYPASISDAQRALRIIRRHADAWNIDPARVGIMGFSAGGHLALTSATIPGVGDIGAPDPIERYGARPDFAVLAYPVVSFVQFTHEGSVTNLLGDNPSYEQRLRLSGEQNVSPATPPMFVWHTADDKSVPVENSLMLAQQLSRSGVPCELHIYGSGPHGLGIATDHPYCGGWTEACANWLRLRGII